MPVDDPRIDRRSDTIVRLGVLERASDPSLTALTRVASYVSGAQAAAVHILDDRMQRRIAATGAPLEDAERENCLCRLVVDDEQRIVCANATTDPRFGYSTFVRGDAPIRFYASLPLRTSDGVVVGALCTFDTREIELGDEQIARLEDLADQVVAQIELTRIAVDLGHAATHDPLTGAVNRLVLGDRLAQAFARRRRRGGETLVGVLDVDDFKAINDRLGHETGDRVLIEIVARLRRTLREEDTVARTGGDEFVILAELPAATEDERVLTRRIAVAFEEPMRFLGGQRMVHVSVGCVLAGPEQPLRELLARADAAMYARKSGARTLAAG